MAPIRIGFIGLSASGGWGGNAHFPYLKDSSKYEITAICNSSVESAEAAIKHFNLSANVKAYGSPEDLAKDANVDLVVCTVRVDTHLKLVKPALEAGKDVYCEWPLAANLAEAQELAVIANNKGVRTVVGLQARKSPIVNKVKELIEDGMIGRLLSCTVVSTAGNMGPQESQKMKYFNELRVGGNMMSIHFGHLLDFVLYAIGELDSFSGLLSTQRRRIDIIDADKNVVEVVTRDTHDQIMIQGQLKDGGVISMHQRGGAPFKNQPGLVWRMYGERGEIMVTSDGSFLQVGYPNMNITLHKFENDSVQNVPWTTPSVNGKSVDDLPMPARNVALLYEAFAAGNTHEYVQMDEAVTRHQILDDLYKKNGISI